MGWVGLGIQFGDSNGLGTDRFGAWGRRNPTVSAVSDSGESSSRQVPADEVLLDIARWPVFTCCESSIRGNCVSTASRLGLRILTTVEMGPLWAAMHVTVAP